MFFVYKSYKNPKSEKFIIYKSFLKIFRNLKIMSPEPKHCIF